MDPLKVLSRSMKIKQTKRSDYSKTRPSAGQNSTPQLYRQKPTISNPSRKRKRRRGPEAIATDFFATSDHTEPASADVASKDLGTGVFADGAEHVVANKSRTQTIGFAEHDARATLTQHKIKVTWINPHIRQGNKTKAPRSKEARKVSKPQLLFPQPVRTFDELQQRFGISSKLTANLRDQDYAVPTEVQMGALPLLLAPPSEVLEGYAEVADSQRTALDLLAVAPTGSGKTLAFIVPLLRRIHMIKTNHANHGTSRHSMLAIILAPTKELARQTTNEARKLAQNTGVKISLVRKGMRLWHRNSAEVSSDRDHSSNAGMPNITEADILVATPGVLYSTFEEEHREASAAFAEVKHLVLDEADVLLDPLFRDQTLAIWNTLEHVDLQISFWSATMGSNIEELAVATIESRRQRLSESTGGSVPETPMVRLVVGLKDSALPNVHHKLVYAATEPGKLMGLRQLLHPASDSAEAGPPVRPPLLVFTQTIERAIALHSELIYDIPAEAGGSSRIAVLHSDLSDTAREGVMTRFRKGEVWVMITTDLLSRGVDFRGVNAVVNYDIPTSSAAYVHRVGRTGRAGRGDGVAVTLYSREDIPYLRHVANVVAVAQKQKNLLGASDQGDLEQWLIDALPKLSKQEKHKLKKRGIQSRAAGSKINDRKAARRSTISSKAGFARRSENNRKGAILASQRRSEMDEADETDFDGFA